jgi:hypothetical protein
MGAPLEAVLCHSTTGRARLRFAGMGGDADGFEQLAHALAQHPYVEQVRVSARTGSMLVLHRAELASILAFAQERGLFVVVGQPAHTPMRRIEAAIGDMDRRLARETKGAFSLGTATFLSLFAAGLYQMRQGKLLPAGMTLFNYALEVMQREASREGTASRRRPDAVAAS